MTNFPQDEPRYTRNVAVQIANVTQEFLEKCETEQLIKMKAVREEEPGYSIQDVRQLALIYRLHEILGISFQDLEVVLHLRNQLLEMQEEMEILEQQMLAREEQLRREMVILRQRLAEVME